MSLHYLMSLARVTIITVKYEPLLLNSHKDKLSTKSENGQTDQQTTDRQTERPTTRILELLRAAKKYHLM